MSESFTALIRHNHEEFLANKTFTRIIVNDFLENASAITYLLEKLRNLEHLSKNTLLLVLYAHFIENLPENTIEDSNLLQEYKIHGEVSLLEFKHTAIVAKRFINNVFDESEKVLGYFNVLENKTVGDKLLMIKDTMKLQPEELNDRMRYHLAFRHYPIVHHVNLLSGQEMFSRKYVDSICKEAVNMVSIIMRNNTAEDVSEPKEDDLGLEQEEGEYAGESYKELTYRGEEDIKSITGETTLTDEFPDYMVLFDLHDSTKENASLFHYPSIKDFTPSDGKELVEAIVDKWCLDEDWMYNTQYSDYTHDKSCEYHKYEVMFSIPTPSYPIPQATASVFFTITINKLQYEECPVEITYNIEGSNYVHHPEGNTFNQDWLHAVLCNKIKFFKMICEMNTI